MTIPIETMITTLKPKVQQRLGAGQDFDAVWVKAVEGFRSWMSGLPAEVSPLTRNIELLRRISEAFANDSIREDQEIRDLILDGAAAEGDRLQIGGVEYEVLRRKISANGGVLYELRDGDGNMKQHEFFD